MTESVAKSRTNELLDELRAVIFSDEKLNDIEFATYKREALNLPSNEESSLIEVLVYCAADRLDEVKDKAMRIARLYAHESFVSSNLIWTMLYLGMPTVAYEIVKRMPLECADEYDVENIVSTNFLFNDFGLDAKLVEWLSRTQQNELLARIQKGTGVRRMVMRDIEARFDVSSNTITDLSLIAARVAETHNGVVLNGTLLDIPPESGHATLTIYVECEPEKLFDLNWDLSGELVEAELDDIKCITHFELVGDDTPTLATRLRNVG
ncbi:hypothetical protein V8046_003617 [Vibrio parahaemolyticus]|uniref:hypothetical protein n=1 Tax=Vibrio TaxID=662 RepID=UPI00111D5326|nr:MULTISPECIES: hypothetical protein [Vibrio]EJU8775912.1 hypothetical protein [Vibrio parahaemolyticus]MDW1938247.1 hypothetical protein [Vibrio sp. 818]MDW2129219.1 hypothetical protein [Vibrio sp. 2129(2023)]MEA5374998.1 hypothetical protein [Vibrio parahaemolyticus]TPA94394.1 hypothetical protein DXJ80_02100 [Vibrio parahaemolyticus]